MSVTTTIKWLDEAVGAIVKPFRADRVTDLVARIITVAGGRGKPGSPVNLSPA